MIRRIVTLLSILSISVQGNEVKLKPQYAVSTQSFHREDVPLSYKYSNVHEYKIKNKAPEQAHNIYRQHNSIPVRYASIQYAPLHQGQKSKEQENSNQNEVIQITQKTERTLEEHLLEEGLHVYSTEGSLKKDHLEPRLLEGDQNQHRQIYRSYIPGHNVAVLPPPKNRYLGHVDPFVIRQENLQKQQPKAPKFVYYQKQKQQDLDNTSTSKRQPVEDTSTSEIESLVFIPQAPIFSKESSSQQRAHEPQYQSLHNELAMEKPSAAYQHIPRLHLNIARIYSIANLLQKAHQPPVANVLQNSPLSSPQYLSTNVAKPPVLAKAFFTPSLARAQKMLMYPVRNEKRENARHF